MVVVVIVIVKWLEKTKHFYLAYVSSAAIKKHKNHRKRLRTISLRESSEIDLTVVIRLN